MKRPYSLRIHLPSGDPDGLRTIEKSNWSGAGLVFPRAQTAEARKRSEWDRTGVYLLAGPPEELGLPRLYIGEGDPIGNRIDQHAAKRDFWTVCLAFTAKDGALNKAHVQYLEARLVELAAAHKRCTLENGNVPARPTLSEADTADAEGFLAEVLLCLPLLGVNVFAAATSPDTGGKGSRSDKALQITSKGIQAHGIETPEGFVVFAGSTAVVAEVPSCHLYLIELRRALVKNGVLKQDGKAYRFTQDYVFPSPSTAAGVVQGRTANGRLDWKTPSGQSLKDIQPGI